MVKLEKLEIEIKGVLRDLKLIKLMIRKMRKILEIIKSLRGFMKISKFRK